MYQCLNCFEYKEAQHFSKDTSKPNGLRAQCRDCRAIRRKELSYRTDLRAPYDVRKDEKYLIHLFKRGAREDLVNVPVKLINSFVPLEKGCQFITQDKRKRCFIRTIHGTIDFPFDALNPKILLELLKTYQIKVILPGEAHHES